MFRGRFEHAIDAKGRLSVPAKFRDALIAHFDGDTNLIVVPNDRCLEVHPLKRWETIEEHLRQTSMFDDAMRKLGRLYMSRARDVELDSAGRILLAPDSRRDAALERDVLLVGMGFPFFEVWDRKRFEEYERSEQHELPALYDKLATRGV